MNRRKFIQNLGRGTILSGLVLSSGYLLFRDKPKENDSCSFDFVCQNCKKADKCVLPEKTVDSEQSTARNQ